MASKSKKPGRNPPSDVSSGDSTTDLELEGFESFLDDDFNSASEDEEDSEDLDTEDESGSGLDTFFEDLSTIDDVEILEEGEDGDPDMIVVAPAARPPPAGLPREAEPLPEAEDAPQGERLAWITGPGMVMALRAGLAMVLVLGIFPAAYFGGATLASLGPIFAYLIWTAALLAFVLLLRPGLPGILIRLFRNRHKHSEQELINHLVFITDISRIARRNILAIENVLETIENSFLRNELRLVVDRVARELIIEILDNFMKNEIDGIKKETRLIREGAWAVLLASALLAASLLGMGGAAMAQAAVVSVIGLSWFFLLMLLERFHSKSHGVYAVLLEMIRDGVLYIERGERPEYIEEDLINYLPPGASKLYDEMKFS